MRALLVLVALVGVLGTAATCGSNADEADAQPGAPPTVVANDIADASAGDTEFAESDTAVPSTNTPEPPPATNTPVPVPPTVPPPPPTVAPPPPPPPPAPSCHPSYQGACLAPNAGDYDCAGGSGNGPNYTGYVTVVGPDVFDLDRDGDGEGCE